MDLLIKIFEIVSAILIVVSLSLVTRWYKVWILYAFASFLFVINCAYNGKLFYAGMGVVLLFMGLKNYWVEKKKRNNNE